MNLKSLRTKIFRKFQKEYEKTIHVEAIVREDLWQNVKELIGNDYVWFIITPTNYDYCKSYFNLKMTKEEFTKILIERIDTLKEANEEIQLHIHLCNVKQFLDKSLQDGKFREALEFMNNNGIHPSKVAPGWNSYNDYTITLAKKYGLKFLYEYSSNPLNRPKIRNGVIIKYYYKFWHDYDFI